MAVATARSPRQPARWVAGLVLLAALAILVVAGFLSQSGQDGGDSAGGIPPPARVPTHTYELDPMDTGRVVGWPMFEPAVGPRDVFVDGDGTVWLTEQNRGVVSSLREGTLTRYRIDTAFEDADGAFALAPGPGGLWFSAYPGGTFGRITSDGRANLFSPLTIGSATLGLAAGADGAMWIADVNRGLVIRIAPDGEYGLVPIPPEGSHAAMPRDLASDPDGGVWFTDTGTDSFGHVSSDGTSVETVATWRGSDPRSLALAADGTLWVALSKDRALARIRPGSDTADEISVPAASGDLNDLAVAADGTLWVTQDSGTVLHLRPDGSAIEKVRLPGGARYADGVAVAQDGTVWAAATDANLVVAIAPSP